QAGVDLPVALDQDPTGERAGQGGLLTAGLGRQQVLDRRPGGALNAGEILQGREVRAVAADHHGGVVAVPGGQLGAGGEIGGEVVVELAGRPVRLPQRAVPVLDLGGRSEQAGGGVGGALGDRARVEGDAVAATAQIVGGPQADDLGADHGDVLHVHVPPDGG